MNKRAGLHAINWLLVLMGFATMLIEGYVDNVRGPIFPDLIHDFSLSDATGSYFFAISSLAGLINNVLVFRWMERVGPLRVVAVYSLVQSLGLLLIGLSGSFFLALVGSALVGASLAAMGVSVNLIVAAGSPRRHRRRLLSALHSFYGAASLGAPLVITLLYRMNYGWRAGFLSIIAFNILCSVVALSFGTFSNIEVGSVAPEHGQELKHHAKRPRPRRYALYFAVLLTLYVLSELAISTRLVLYCRRDLQIPFDQANRYLALFFVGMFLGRISMALVHLRHDSRRILLVSGGASLVLFALGLLVSPWNLALAGFTMSVFYPAALECIHEDTDGWASYVTSWCITSHSLGLVTMHPLLGEFADLIGLGRALWLGPICLGVSLLMIALKPRFMPFLLGENGSEGRFS